MSLLLHRRPVLVPTRLGWALLFALGCGLIGTWAFCGESFLATTIRVPADILVVEAWMQEEGARAAITECTGANGHYRCVVAAGGLTGEWWYQQRWNETEIVERSLQQNRFPMSQFVPALADTERHRTYAAAVAARDALAARHIKPLGVNVLTVGAHARRSRLVYAKVFGPTVPVGVISWHSSRSTEVPWWKSSGRTVDLLKESLGYIYEAAFGSGRWLDGADRDARPAPDRNARRE